MSNKIGSGPIEKEYELKMKALGVAIDEFINPDGKQSNGFIVMMFKFGDTSAGRMNYLTNADRKDVITALKEQLAYFEGMPDNQSGKC